MLTSYLSRWHLFNSGHRSSPKKKNSLVFKKVSLGVRGIIDVVSFNATVSLKRKYIIHFTWIIRAELLLKMKREHIKCQREFV